jgi:hypothetical protein
MILAALLLSSLCLSACTSAPLATAASQCANLDWFESGRSDGALGMLVSPQSHLKPGCDLRSTQFNRELYSNGHDVGLLDYCTTKVGLDMGKDGKPYAHVCPEYLEAGFLRGYDLGTKIRRLELENTEVEDRMLEASGENSASESQPTSDPRSEIELEQLRKRRSQIDSEINDLEQRSL